MTTITQTLTTLSNPIDRTNMTAAQIRVAGDTTISELSTIFGQINTMNPQINTVAGEVNTNASNAASSETVALAAANFKGDYDDLTGALSVPASVYHDGNYWMLLSDLADVTAKEPGVDSEWAAIFNYTAVVNKTSSGTLAASDLTGKTIHNDGAGAEVILTWPALVTGQKATFYVNDAQYLQIKAPAATTIRIGSVTTAAAGYIRANTVGNFVTVTAMPDGLVVSDYLGTWNYDQ